MLARFVKAQALWTFHTQRWAQARNLDRQMQKTLIPVPALDFGIETWSKMTFHVLLMNFLRSG